MPWYLPITILPGIALIILSTTNLLTALNDEISKLNLKKEFYKLIINKKLGQLKLLIITITSLYISAFLMVLSGLLIAIEFSLKLYLPKIVLLIGVLVLFIAIILLLVYTIRSYKIRLAHLKL